MVAKKKRGGVRPGAGRPKGSVGARGRLRKLSEEQLAAVVNTSRDPREFLLNVMQGTIGPAGDLQVRMRAAEIVLPYIHPRLTQNEHSGKDGRPIEIDMSDNEFARRIALILTGKT